MPIIPPDRAAQLNSLVPTGFPYKLRGALLAKQDDPFQIPFTGLQPNFLYDLYVNDDRRRSFTSDSNGELLVSVELDAGSDYELRLFPFGGTEFGQRRIWVSVRNWATFHSTSSEKILQLDESIGVIYDGLRLDSAAIDELNNYHGKNLLQANNSNYGTSGFRETLRMLRQAYLNEGGSVSGIRNAVSSSAFINPLIKSGKELSIWWLDDEISDDFRFSSRLTSNDLDLINQHVLTGIGTISSSSPSFGISNITLVEPDNLRFEFAAGWDGGDLVVTGTTKFGVDVEEVIFSSPGNVVESNFSYTTVSTIVKTIQGSAGNAFVGYVNAKFIKITKISSFTTPDVTNTLEYRPAPLPGIERFIYNGSIAREQSNNASGTQTYRIYPPRVEAEVSSVTIEPFDLSGNARYFSFEIDGRGRVNMDFNDYVGTNITSLNAVTASELVQSINDELSGRANYGASYSTTAEVITTTAGDSFKITASSDTDSNIDLNERDVASFIKLYYSGNANDFVDQVFNIELDSINRSQIFFGRQSDEWFDIEVNYAFKPLFNVSDNFEFLGSNGPDNFKITGLNIIGFVRTSLSLNRSLILEATNPQWRIEKIFPEILEKVGKVLTLQMIVSIGNSSLSISSPFQFFMSFDGGATYYSFNTIVGSQPTPRPIGTTNYEMGDYHQTFTSKAYIPLDAETAILRIQGNNFQAGDVISIEDISVFEEVTTAKFLSRNTVTRGPSYNFLRSELNAWFPERSSINEREDIGLEDKEGHIQRIKPANTVFDRFNATELNFTRRDEDTNNLIGNPALSNSTAINVVGVWSAEQFENSTLINFETIPNSPRKSSFIRPTNITDTDIIDIEFNPFEFRAFGFFDLVGSVNTDLVQVIPLNASGTASLTGSILISPVVIQKVSATASSTSASIFGDVEDGGVSVIPAVAPVASLVLNTAGTIHTNDTVSFNATATSGTYPMTWELESNTLGVIDSGTWNAPGDFDTIITSVLGTPPRTESFDLSVTNVVGVSTDDEDVAVTTAMNLNLVDTISLNPGGDSFPHAISLPTGQNRGLFVLLAWDGVQSPPSHAQLGTTIVTFLCRSTISTSALPNAERQCAIYYFSESDLAAGTTNNQLRFSDFLTPTTFINNWAVHIYSATNVGTVTPNPGVLNGAGGSVISSVINTTEFSRILSLSVAVGNVHGATTNFIGTDDTNSGTTGQIRSIEAIPNAMGQVQFVYTDNATVSPRSGYCYVIVDPV